MGGFAVLAGRETSCGFAGSSLGCRVGAGGIARSPLLHTPPNFQANPMTDFPLGRNTPDQQIIFLVKGGADGARLKAWTDEA